MEEERIQKFKDLILNEHYCEDCNELCGIGEAFPLEFVTQYIIKLEKENQSYRDYFGEPPCYDNASYISKSILKEFVEENKWDSSEAEVVDANELLKFMEDKQNGRTRKD